MSKYNSRLKLSDSLTLRAAVLIGVILLAGVSVLACRVQITSTSGVAEDAMNTMKQQCISFNRLTVADRTKSLFRLSELMSDLSTHLENDSSRASDRYLEQYVDRMRISGVALLDNDLKLEASGYTRQFSNAEWMYSPDGSRFADIIKYPEKVYSERVEHDGEYYDMCAVFRRDAPGIIVGFYRQPSGLITDTENDLKSMLTGIHLDNDGHYVISENGYVRVTGDEYPEGSSVSDSSFLQKLSQIPKDETLHLFYDSGKYYWGYRSGCENYSICIYYPFFTIFSASLIAAAVFASAYSILMLLMFAVRHRALYENREELKKSNHELLQTVKMLQSLETIYFSLFYVDLKEDTYKTVYIAPWLREAVPQDGIYTDLKQIFLDSMVVPAFKEDIDSRMSIEFITEALKQENLTDVRKSFYTDYQAIRGDTIRWCRVTATVVDYDGDGMPRHSLALIQDIDDEKAREADYEAQILKESYEAKVANNAKSEFLRRISHDIRTPVNGIKGYMELAAAHPEDRTLQDHCRERAMSALHALLELVNSVLDMSKLESSEIELEEKLFDITELLNNLNIVIDPQAADRGISYEVLRKDPLPVTRIIGSPRLVSQVLLNITSNAVKFTQPGGHVRVNTRMVSRTEDTVTYAFVCEDDGIGMSDEFQRHMFEPFTQEAVSARTTYEGAGLGLSIVKKLIDAMDGTVSCHSEEGKVRYSKFR